MVDLTNFFDTTKKKSEKESEKVFKEWEFQQPVETQDEEVSEQPPAVSEIIKEAIGDVGEKPEGIEEVIEQEIEEEKAGGEQPPEQEIVQEETAEEKVEEVQAPSEVSVEEKKILSRDKDEFVAHALHELVMANGWTPVKTTPEKDYFMFTYLPPSNKRMWMQARIYITKLNLEKPLKIEGLTIPHGMEERLAIVIRMQKSGGIGQIMNSKTITETLDTNNYFNENSELVNENGLRAVLNAYLRQAEIM